MISGSGQIDPLLYMWEHLQFDISHSDIGVHSFRVTSMQMYIVLSESFATEYPCPGENLRMFSRAPLSYIQDSYLSLLLLVGFTPWNRKATSEVPKFLRAWARMLQATRDINREDGYLYFEGNSHKSKPRPFSFHESSTCRILPKLYKITKIP